jgi:hypothetical protein
MQHCNIAGLFLLNSKDSELELVQKFADFLQSPQTLVFHFTTASRTALGPTQPPVQWVPGALSLGVKQPGREADHSPPSSAEVKE